MVYCLNKFWVIIAVFCCLRLALLQCFLAPSVFSSSPFYSCFFLQSCWSLAAGLICYIDYAGSSPFICLVTTRVKFGVSASEKLNVCCASSWWSYLKFGVSASKKLNVCFVSSLWFYVASLELWKLFHRALKLRMRNLCTLRAYLLHVSFELAGWVY